MPEAEASLYRRIRFYAGNAYRLASSPWKQRLISPSEARTIYGCSFGDEGWNHLRETLKEYDANSRIHYRDTTLFQYLTRFQPKSICQLLKPTPPKSDWLPLFVYPWGTFRKREVAAHKDAWTSRFCGPSSEEFVAEEFHRTISLYRQLKKSGYKPWRYGHTFIGGTFMHDANGERRFVILQGNHRAAILAHLGWKQIAVRDVPGYLARLRENEAESWPLVGRGACTPDLARRIFRLFFTENGRHMLGHLGGRVIYPVAGNQGA
jgi:hypothetical protein